MPMWWAKLTASQKGAIRRWTTSAFLCNHKLATAALKGPVLHTIEEEAAKRRGSCVELLGEQVEGDSPPKQTEGDSTKQTEGDEGKAGMGRRGSAVGEKEEGHKEAKDKLGNIPKLQRQRTRTRTISTSVYQDTEGRPLAKEI